MSCGINLSSMQDMPIDSKDRIEGARIDLLKLKISKNDRQIIKRVQKQYNLDAVAYAGRGWFDYKFKYKLEYSNFQCEKYREEGEPERFEFHFNEL